ncbi:variable large family protein [Borrelia puertoricensis]|uniref:variable large family protein n=1 Tax=Borrelia puertoricensis TaxID=2756107 RepID=UPI001FF3ED83|nr:variable large family protein [Borrelia puertoricensis]UPA19327.1 variable large family protein [Borrelia puertoricensis]
MTLFLLLSCGSGHQSATGGGAATGGSSLSSVLMNISRSAENAFYSFLELLSDTLGFRVTKDTKKSDVADYFNSLGAKLGKASEELEEVAKNSETELDKVGINKIIRSAVDTAKATLITLKTHLDSLKDIGDANKVVEVTSQQNGAAANTDKLKTVYNSLKGIVDIAKTEGVEGLKKSEVTLASNSIGVEAKDGAKVLTTGAAGAAVGDKAAAIVAAVRGDEMLASIVASQEGDVKAVTEDVKAETTPLEFAKGGTADHLAKEAAKAAAVAGGIALRSLVKDGKLASHSGNDEKAVEAAGITAVNKLLVSIEDIIKKTVKNVLEKAKGEIDKARAPKTANQQ